VVLPAAASQLRFRKEAARRATLQTRGFATQVRLVGVSGFDGELGDLCAGLSADPREGEKALEAKDAVRVVGVSSVALSKRRRS
jgi:hypothetical protein